LRVLQAVALGDDAACVKTQSFCGRGCRTRDLKSGGGSLWCVRLDNGAHSSICLSRARGGREATQDTVLKRVRRERAPSSLCLRVLRLAGGREIPYRRQAPRRGPPRVICLVPSGAQNNPSDLACQEYNTIYWVCLFVRSHRACTLRFYLRRVAGRFLGENRRVPAPARGFAEAVGGVSFSSNSPGASGRRTRG